MEHYDLTKLAAGKTTHKTVVIPFDLSVDLDYAATDRKAAGIENRTIRDVVTEGIAAILEVHKEIKPAGTLDALPIIRVSVDLFMDLARKYAQEHNIELKEALGKDLAAWLKDRKVV
jgi:hypothetical protein